MYKHRHKNRRKNKQRKIIVGSMIGLLAAFTVGYSAFNTTLNINVKGNIKSDGLKPVIKEEKNSADELRTLQINYPNGCNDIYVCTYSVDNGPDIQIYTTSVGISTFRKNINATVKAGEKVFRVDYTNTNKKNTEFGEMIVLIQDNYKNYYHIVNPSEVPDWKNIDNFSYSQLGKIPLNIFEEMENIDSNKNKFSNEDIVNNITTNYLLSCAIMIKNGGYKVGDNYEISINNTNFGDFENENIHIARYDAKTNDFIDQTIKEYDSTTGTITFEFDKPGIFYFYILDNE